MAGAGVRLFPAETLFYLPRIATDLANGDGFVFGYRGIQPEPEKFEQVEEPTIANEANWPPPPTDNQPVKASMVNTCRAEQGAADRPGLLTLK